MTQFWGKKGKNKNPATMTSHTSICVYQGLLKLKMHHTKSPLYFYSLLIHFWVISCAQELFLAYAMQGL